MNPEPSPASVPVSDGSESGSNAGLPDDLLMFASTAWFARRRDRWNDEARDFVRALRAYEDFHPDDAICFAKALSYAEHAAGMVRHAD